ncbi:MAG TPA: DUF5939 domain-containing protein, partial [Balneolaceae bacterium]|nr:DUF5939 domain-containing protein [Balneolaceae bacterium]
EPRRFGLISLLSILKIKTLIKRRLKKAVYSYDTLAFQGYKPFQVSKEHRLVRGGEKRLQQIKQELNPKVDNAILDKLIDFIRKGDDLELQRIQPYELAEYWGISRKEVFETFIRVTKAGLLNFKWDLRCPTCRTVQESEKTLNQIHEPIRCKHCHQNFGVNFNNSLQLSFTPNPLIRKIDPGQYCIRGPQQKSHILIQQYLQPGDKRFLKTELPVGTYTLRTSQSDGLATVHVQASGQNTINITIQKQGLRGEEVSIAPDPNLSFENKSSVPQIITLEKKSWNNNEVSAARATSSQLFRTLFANEILPKGEKISVDNLTLMFTDLFNSTGVYNEEGDDKAVGQVINHFEILNQTVAEEGGAIVKTIGDSVMAVFCHPHEALRAYLRAQKILFEDEQFHNNFQLKAGIHQGSCVAVNLNNRIDYFGSTVNIASRFVDYASVNEVIISHGACTQVDSDINKILDDFKHVSMVKNIDARLKGFNKESFAVKSIKIDNSPLRLAI